MHNKTTYKGYNHMHNSNINSNMHHNNIPFKQNMHNKTTYKGYNHMHNRNINSNMHNNHIH